MILMAVGPVDRDDFLSWLYEQYSDYIYKLAWDSCSEPQDIDDLVQTVWEKLISKEQALQTLDKPQQLNYISKTMKNTLREEARRKKLLTCSLDSVVGCSTDPIGFIDDAIDQAIQLRVFREVWPQINEDIRELLERKYDLNETDEEIAQSMGIKPASVRMYLSRARKQARKILNEHKHLLLR